ncbi:hypothetical protein ABBQ38_008906 [Trebouxia sp. C0009 RCD-2024]
MSSPKMRQDRQKIVAFMQTMKVELITAFAILVLGIGVGLAVPEDQSMPHLFNRIITISGWLYFFSWSVSFYPQFFLNLRKKSVVGLSLDYASLNVMGFICYSIFNIAFFFDPGVQEQYRLTHNGHSNAVHLNDVFFAVHAALLASLTLVQCFVYERGTQKVSRLCAAAIGFTVTASCVSFLLVLFDNRKFPLLTSLYWLSWVKMGVTFFKYMPQVWLNYKRQSTLGWNINQVLLDFSGGVFSLFQLCMEAFVKADMSAISGDPVKFGLGLVTVIFDLMFMVQHYSLYRVNNAKLLEEAPKARYTMVSPTQSVSRRTSQQDEQLLLASATTSVSDEGISRPQLPASSSMDVVSTRQSSDGRHEV